eukprot:m.124905 g.124905  ORF g.124905 m.124905 type:complete len:1399 (-) comp13788_c1_seq1:374-4570(-)
MAAQTAGTTLEWSGALLQLCNELGLKEVDVQSPVLYHKGVECLDVLKDVLRNLRTDVRNSQRPVLRQLGEFEFLQKDLILLLIQYAPDPNERALMLTLLRVITSITLPTYIVFQYETQGHAMEGLESTVPFQQVTRYLQRYKDAFVSNYQMVATPEEVEAGQPEGPYYCRAALRALLQLLYGPLTADPRTDDDDMMIELVLTIFRNILHVPNPTANGTSGTLHDKAVMAFEECGIIDIIMHMCHDMEENTQFKLILTELVALLFREQTASSLIHCLTEERAKVKGDRDARLKALRIRDQQQHAAMHSKRHSRHSRFGGTFQVKSLAGSGVAIKVKTAATLTAPEDIEDDRKRRRKVVEAHDGTTTASSFSPLAVRTVLYKHAVTFINDCYNVLIPLVERDLTKSAHASGVEAEVLHYDRANYLRMLRLFMEFHRLQLQEPQDARCRLPTTVPDRETNKIPPKFAVEIVGSSLSQRTLTNVEQIVDEYFKNLTDTTTTNAALWARRLHVALRAFHELLCYYQYLAGSPVERQQNFSEAMISKAFYLEEFLDIFPKMMVRYNQRTESFELLSDLVETVHLVLKLLSSQTSKMFIKTKRQRRAKASKAKPKPKASKDKKSKQAKAAVASTAADHVGELDEDAAQAAVKQQLDALFDSEDDTGNEECAADEEEFDEARLMRQEEFAVKEAEFHFNAYLEKFRDFRIVHAYCEVLRRFKTNSSSVNHAVVKMFDRLAHEAKLNMRPMFYQLGVLRLFLDLLEDPEIQSQKQHSEIRGFIKRGIVAPLVQDLEKNPLLYMEILFEKTVMDVEEIKYGHSTARQRHKSKTKAWSADDEARLEQAFKAHEGEDDVMVQLLDIFDGRSKRAISLKLRKMGLIFDKSKWTESDDDLLREAFAKYREEDDPVDAILHSGMLDESKISRSRVLTRLRKLGLYRRQIKQRVDAPWKEDELLALRKAWLSPAEDVTVKEKLELVLKDPKLSSRPVTAVRRQLIDMGLMVAQTRADRKARGKRKSQKKKRGREKGAKCIGLLSNLPEDMGEALVSCASALRSGGLTAQMALSDLLQRLDRRATALERRKASDNQLKIAGDDEEDAEDFACLSNLLVAAKFITKEQASGSPSSWEIPHDSTAQHLRDVIDALTPAALRNKPSMVVTLEAAEREAAEEDDASSTSDNDSDNMAEDATSADDDSDEIDSDGSLNDSDYAPVQRNEQQDDLATRRRTLRKLAKMQRAPKARRSRISRRSQEHSSPSAAAIQAASGAASVEGTPRITPKRRVRLKGAFVDSSTDSDSDGGEREASLLQRYAKAKATPTTMDTTVDSASHAPDTEETPVGSAPPQAKRTVVRRILKGAGDKAGSDSDSDSDSFVDDNAREPTAKSAKRTSDESASLPETFIPDTEELEV